MKKTTISSDKKATAEMCDCGERLAEKCVLRSGEHEHGCTQELCHCGDRLWEDCGLTGKGDCLHDMVDTSPGRSS